jgi:hypothetical protein
MGNLTVHFSADKYSPWMISNYIDRFSSITTNLAIAKKLAIVLSEGQNPTRIRLMHNSRDLWDIHYPVRAENYEDSVAGLTPLVSTNKRGPNEDFFRRLRRLKRPMPIIISEDEIKPLVDIYSSETVQLRTASFDSPGDVTFSLGLGLSELLNEIRFGKKRQLLEQEKHKHEIRAIDLDNQKREQEVLALALNNVDRMKKLQTVHGEYAIKIDETMKIAIGSLNTLNEKANIQLSNPTNTK